MNYTPIIEFDDFDTQINVEEWNEMVLVSMELNPDEDVFLDDDDYEWF
mgnify:CR=1 FL=1